MHRLPSMVLFVLSLAGAQEPLRRAADHPDYGLPHPQAVWDVYSAEHEHPCNALWREIYLVACAPKEVAGALPAEHGAAAEFFTKGWYFQKRDGEARDARLFGGDGRQMPREGFSAEEAARVATWLRAVDGDVAAELKARPRAAVWFQHDLLRLARRLTNTKQNPELIAPILECAMRVALPADVLRSAAVRTATSEHVFAAVPDVDPARMIEVERRSSRLFDAEWVQLWSTVHVQFPDRAPAALTEWLAAGDARDPVPVGTLAVLTQGIVAVAADGAPVATDLVIEARVQRLQNRDPLSADNRTTTRDGVDFAMWSLPRRAVRDLDGDATSVPFASFRAIDMESQELFRDYGTRKHTTYAAQCALCHRRTNTPDEALAGFSALRVSSAPRRALPGERRRRAEGEMLRFLDKLRDR